MAQRLALLARNMPAMSNGFDNQKRLAYLQAQEPPEDPAERSRFRFDLGLENLRAGSSETAARIFEEVLNDLEQNPGLHTAGFSRRLRGHLATAYLRVGEQQNCIDHHGRDSCLLPIRGSGVHRDPRGSRAALEQLKTLLRENPEDLTSRWLYNLASMTLGEYPHNVPERWLVPSTAFESGFEIGRFFDVAQQVGLATSALAGGSVTEDLDGDGDLDVMASSWNLADPLRVFENRGSAGSSKSSTVFEERSVLAGLSGLNGGLNLVHADYDNDGDVDIFVLRGAWLSRQGRQPNSLLQNDGKGFFRDVTEEAGLLSFHPTQTAAWADFDNDGWLDLFIGNEGTPTQPHAAELYLNNGRDADGRVTFTDVAESAGVASSGFVKGVVAGDYDNDGWQDLYLSRLRAKNLLYRNLGRGSEPRFEEVAETAGVGEPIDSFPVWFFDADNDGWLDLFVGAYAASFVDARATDVIAGYLGLPIEGSVSRFYHNLRDGTFEDRAAVAGLDLPLLAMGANFGDLDNDGWLDVYAGTGSPDFRALIPNRMFRNDQGRAFQDVTTSGGFGHLQKGHGISFADLDNDGDQDIFAVMGGAFSGDVYPNALFANPGHGHRWITLRLEGAVANRSAIGARLRLDVQTARTTRQIFATVSTGGSFGSSSLQQEIGLGEAVAIRRLEVQWPGGDLQIFENLPLDRIVKLREGRKEPMIVDPSPFDLLSAEVSAGHRP